MPASSRVGITATAGQDGQDGQDQQDDDSALRLARARVGPKGTAAPDATLAERRSNAWAGDSNGNRNGMTGLAGWTGL